MCCRFERFIIPSTVCSFSPPLMNDAVDGRCWGTRGKFEMISSSGHGFAASEVRFLCHLGVMISAQSLVWWLDLVWTVYLSVCLFNYISACFERKKAEETSWSQRAGLQETRRTPRRVWLLILPFPTSNCPTSSVFLAWIFCLKTGLCLCICCPKNDRFKNGWQLIRYCGNA